MNKKIVKDYAIAVLIEQAPKEQTEIKLQFFQHLINNGLVDYQRLFKGCVNHFYNKEIKINGASNKFTVIDAAIEFDCSVGTIHNVIYKFRKIELVF